MTDQKTWLSILEEIEELKHNFDDLVKVVTAAMNADMSASVTVSTAPLASIKPRRTEITSTQIKNKHHELGRRDNHALPSIRQEQYIRDMCESRDAFVVDRVDTSHEASALIRILQDMPYVPAADRHELLTVNGVTEEAVHFKQDPPPTQAPPPPPELDKMPYAAFERLIPDGRYAVNAADGKQILFLRINTTDKFNGKTVTPYRRISYKAGEDWRLIQIYLQSGKVSGSNEKHGTVIADALAEISANAPEAAMKYAEYFDECVNCGKELTDDRSRYFSLGTDCIKRRHDIVRYIEKTKGQWYAGAAS